MINADEELELQELAQSEWQPELEWEQEPELSFLESLLRGFSFRGQMIPGLVPAFLMNFFLPPVLTWIYMEGRTRILPETPFGVEKAPLPPAWNIGDLFEHLVKNGPPSAVVGVILAMVLMRWLRTYPQETPYREYPHVFTGAHAGAIYAFLNLPIMMAFQPLYRDDGIWPIRMSVLILWMGLLWGGWVGWMAYREHHYERGWLPPLTVKTVATFLGGGALIVLLFAPGFLKVGKSESVPVRDPRAIFKRGELGPPPPLRAPARKPLPPVVRTA
jgi:hypothetical protein